MLSQKKWLEVRDLFFCHRLPGRLTEEQVAALLGVTVFEVRLLVRGGMLSPLGRPAKNARKYFSSVEVEAYARERTWLDRASRLLAKAVHEKNAPQHGRVAAPNRFRGHEAGPASVVPANTGGNGV